MARVDCHVWFTIAKSRRTVKKTCASNNLCKVQLQSNFISQILSLPWSMIALTDWYHAYVSLSLPPRFQPLRHDLNKDHYARAALNRTVQLNFLVWVKKQHQGCHFTAQNQFWHVKQLINTSKTTQNWCRSYVGKATRWIDPSDKLYLLHRCCEP
jgi:hypothetical protein